LGFDPKVRAHLIEDLNVIISCAASVNFREHLFDAMKTNYYGAVSMLDLAHACKHLSVLSHVSTAYVGSNYPNHSVVKEVIQKDLCKDDWEVQIKNVLAMDREEVTKQEVALLSGYKNTYTYTKNLAERHLERYRGNLRIVINRPS
jgi:nucleoside-diphosphate-sugar epimerase